MGLMDFFTPEAGQQRRKWLDAQLGGMWEYVPPEMRPFVALGNEVNPITSMERAGQGAARVADPNVQGWDKVQAVGDTASNMAGFVAPMFAASKGAVPAVNAVEDAMIGWSQAAGVPQFAASEFGGVGFADDAASRGAEIMAMLKSGRGAEVTDEMLDMGDATMNARLNEWLYNNYDLPMDAGSRAARAGEMGFADTSLYHGSKVDFNAFDPTKIAPHNARGRGFYMTDSTSSAAGYSGGSGMNRIDMNIGTEQNVAPLRASGRILDERKVMTPAEVAEISDEFSADHFDSAYPANGSNVLQEFSYRPDEQNAALRAAGYSGRIGPGIVDGRDAVIFDPRNIRSRFARFDPRLSHLRNLSAGIAGLGLMQYGQPQE